tara:strand:+ start:3191 stop:4930 length:1740 start_codon:yes stop_codon:yes gene_type:complete
MATVSRLHVNVTAGTADYAKSMAKNEQRTKGFSKKIGKMGGALKAAAGTAVAASAALAGVAFAGKKIFDLGAGIEETASKFNTVFGPQGTAQMNEFLDGFANKAGLTTNEAKALTSVTGSIAQGLGFAQKESAGMAIEITKLAGDLSSFNNMPTEEVLMAVNSALTGEREQMKRLGIVIRETDVQQLALIQSGKTVAATLTSQEKATATLTLMTEKAGVAVGDLDRTQGSAANVAKKLFAQFKELRDVLAQALMPVFREILTAISNNSSKFDEMKEKIKANSNVIVAWGRVAVSAFMFVAKTIMAPITLIGNLIQAFGNLMVATKAFFDKDKELRKQAMEDYAKNQEEAILFLASPLKELGNFTTLLTEALMASGQAGKGFAQSLNQVGETINGSTLPAVRKAQEEIEKFNNDVGVTVEMLNEKLRGMTQEFASGMVNNIVSSLSTMSNAFGSFFSKMQKQLVEATLQWLVFKALTGLFPDSEFVANLTGTQTQGTKIAKAVKGQKRRGGGERINLNPIPAGIPAGTVVRQEINFNVSAIDSRSAAEFIQQNKGDIAKVVTEASGQSTGYLRQLTRGGR